MVLRAIDIACLSAELPSGSPSSLYLCILYTDAQHLRFRDDLSLANKKPEPRKPTADCADFADESHRRAEKKPR
jgi:hypothetical protein